jgi:uncharacterized membrane protein
LAQRIALKNETRGQPFGKIYLKAIRVLAPRVDTILDFYDIALNVADRVLALARLECNTRQRVSDAIRCYELSLLKAIKADCESE